MIIILFIAKKINDHNRKYVFNFLEFMEYVKENLVAPTLADAHASKRQKTTARAEINMLNTLENDLSTVLKDVTNAQAKNSGISNVAYAASAQSRLQNQTRFPCETMASTAFAQTKKDLEDLQERNRGRSSRSGATQSESSKRKASAAVAPSSSDAATSNRLSFSAFFQSNLLSSS